MRSTVIEQSKRTLRLSTMQRSLIVGTLLGDGHLETQNEGHTYRLNVEHSAKQQVYVEWFYEKLKNLAQTPPKSKQKKLGEMIHENYYFQTLSLSQLRFYGQQFYDASGKKKVPRQIRRWLTPLAVAVWFMDDGSLKSKHHRALLLNTQCFNKADVKLLQAALQANFSVNSSIRTQKDGLQIVIVGSDAESLVTVMKPYVLASFTYKFCLLDK